MRILSLKLRIYMKGYGIVKQCLAAPGAGLCILCLLRVILACPGDKAKQLYKHPASIVILSRQAKQAVLFPFKMGRDEAVAGD